MNKNLDPELKKIILDLVYFKDGQVLKTSFNGVQISINKINDKIMINLTHIESGCFYQVITEEVKLNDFSTIGDYNFIMQKLKIENSEEDKTLTLHTTQLNEYTKNTKLNY